MKKVLKIALALAMAMALTCTAFAAGSKTTQDIAEMVNNGAVTDANGAAVEVTVKDSDVTITREQAEEIIDAAASVAYDVAAADLTVVDIKDVTVPEGTAFPVQITFTGIPADKDQNVYVFHHNGSAWELVATGKGPSVTATFKSLSPVAIVVEAQETTTGTGAATSDKTAESNVVLLAAAAVLVAGTAACVVSKKKA